MPALKAPPDPACTSRAALAFACLLSCGCLLGGAAQAQSIDRLKQRAWVQASAMHADVDSLIRLDYLGDPVLGLPAVGTTLDFEDNLGLRRTLTVPDIALGLRLSERWRLEAETYSLNRRSTQVVLNDSVVLDGVTYAASAQLESSFSSRVQRLSVGYSLLKNDSAEAGLALGVQYTRYRLAFVGVGQVTGEPPATTRVEQRDSGPLPTIGVYASTSLGGPWSVAARIDYLPVDSKRVNGYLGNAEANVYFQLASNWTLGLGYKAVSYKVERKSDSDLGARFEYRIRGPQVLLEAGF